VQLRESRHFKMLHRAIPLIHCRCFTR